MKVMPVRRWIWRSSERICWRSLRSRADSGSSRSRTLGSTASARAIATRCFCPPESSSMRRPAKPGSAMRSSISSTLRRRAGAGMPRTSRPKAMFCSTVISGKRARFWKISAVGRRFGGKPASDLPARRISPALGGTNPETMRRIVVLPQPDGPRNEKNSPSGIERSRPCTAVKLPKRFTTPMNSRSFAMPSGCRLLTRRCEPCANYAGFAFPAQSAGAPPGHPDGARPVTRSGGGDLVHQRLALGQEPGPLRPLDPELVDRITRIGIGEVLLEGRRHMLVETLDHGIVAGVVGDDSADLGLERPVDEGIGLVEIGRTRGERDRIEPGQGTLDRRQVVIGASLVLELEDRTVPGLADEGAVLLEAGLGIGGALPPVDDLGLVVDDVFGRGAVAEIE